MEVNGYTIEPCADLYGADLSKAHLGFANLEDANLKGANLSALVHQAPKWKIKDLYLDVGWVDQDLPRSCAEYGFNPSKDGWFYLIENEVRDMFQIGISNYLENRLDRHASGGWEVIEVRGPMDGFLTQDLERMSLRALKRRGALLGRKGSIEKFDGHTEAWTKKSLNVTSIKQILDWVYEDDESSWTKKFDA